MGVFVVPHTNKDILAEASKKSVSSLCIPLLVVNLITLKVSGIPKCWETLCGGSKNSNIKAYRYASMRIFQ